MGPTSLRITNQQYVFGLLRIFIAIFCAGFLSAQSPSAAAHEVRLAYLELNETAAKTYAVMWKVPARGDNLRLSLSVQLPEQCKNQSDPIGAFVGNAHTLRWQIHCANSLIGQAIQIDGLAETGADALVRMQFLDGNQQVGRLTAAAPTLIVPAVPGGLQTAATYFKLGVEHILLGIDHLLFVFALLLIVTGTQRLLITVTAFTIAHSITLAAATLGFVHVPQAPIEAIIALSIVFVASELLRMQRGQASLTVRAPWSVAFVFGLLHGFGFAGALSEVGLPPTRIPMALLFFNVGVEIGQLLFVVAVLAIKRWLQKPIRMKGPGRMQRPGRTWPRWLAQVPPYAIGSIAMFWVIDRIAMF